MLGGLAPTSPQTATGRGCHGRAGLQLPYPQVNFDVEFALAWLWFLIEIPRLFLGAYPSCGWGGLGGRGVVLALGSRSTVCWSVGSGSTAGGPAQRTLSPSLPFSNPLSTARPGESWTMCPALLHVMCVPRPVPCAASKGNKTERATPIFLSFVLALPLLALFVYYLQFQTYV